MKNEKNKKHELNKKIVQLTADLFIALQEKNDDEIVDAISLIMKSFKTIKTRKEPSFTYRGYRRYEKKEGEPFETLPLSRDASVCKNANESVSLLCDLLNQKVPSNFKMHILEMKTKNLKDKIEDRKKAIEGNISKESIRQKLGSIALYEKELAQAEKELNELKEDPINKTCPF